MLANRVATYAPTALPIASGMPKAQSTSRVSAKIRRLCKPTTSRIKAFMAFPCLTAGCTVIDPCVSVCCMSLAGKSCASVDEPVRGWFNFTATRYEAVDPTSSAPVTVSPPVTTPTTTPPPPPSEPPECGQIRSRIGEIDQQIEGLRATLEAPKTPAANKAGITQQIAQLQSERATVATRSAQIGCSG